MTEENTAAVVVPVEPVATTEPVTPPAVMPPPTPPVVAGAEPVAPAPVVVDPSPAPLEVLYILCKLVTGNLKHADTQVLHKFVEDYERD